ncbi:MULTISPECIES: sulfurtransferase TusA family protein [unclassified Acinetobacter]|uniref:sulfurtransferase TusA family protein n=1 Tax=unclassified Acinetobacter TaxID=196816 RepID=UPI0029344217|nr:MULTISPECIES: sulfurtransferase TusA family protein [unclassified Acinetobacter]WOE31707.1 sulfurtransferase TusA family protein [Acinetobacter sp. SAAs470]WOE37173.1 sulfurtransferase TusA family protein [Acinetobacter sp. SAAs474]
MSEIEIPINVIDAMGKPCPMPLLMLKKSLKNQDFHKFLLKSSDPHSLQDVLRYCQIHQISCEAIQISEHEFHYVIVI